MYYIILYEKHSTFGRICECMCCGFMINCYCTVAPFVLSNFIPRRVDRTDANLLVTLICPFYNAGNPPPKCTWNRFDSNNISHQFEFPLVYTDDGCISQLLFHEDDNGLYQCTGYNEVGNATYTFPERFIVESEYRDIV